MIRRIVRVLNFVSTLPFALGSVTAVAMPHQPEDPWQVAQRANTATDYTRFIMKNPDSPYTSEAAARIASLAGARPVLMLYAPHGRFTDDEAIEKFGETRLMNI